MRCEICKEEFDEEEMYLTGMSNGENGVGWECVWVCRNCEEDLESHRKEER